MVVRALARLPRAKARTTNTQRTHCHVAHFLLTTLWDSLDAIKRFAGENCEMARYYPEDEDYLLEREPHVTHTDVLMAVLPAEPQITDL